MTIESNLAELLLERDYRQLLSRFAQASDDGRYEDVLVLFAENATYRVGETLLQGRDAIRERISAGPPDRRCQHLYANTSFFFDDDQVRASSDFAYLSLEDGSIHCRAAGRLTHTVVASPLGLSIVDHVLEMI
jgi:hypothetical protein